jgi:hypothetical protein
LRPATREPGTSRPWPSLKALAQFELGSLVRAVRSFAHAIELDSTYADNLLVLLRPATEPTAFDLGPVRVGLEALRKSEPQDQTVAFLLGVHPVVISYLGVKQPETRNLERSVVLLSEVLAADPDHLAARIGRAYANALLGKKGEVGSDLDKAAQLDARSFFGPYMTAAILMHMEQPDAALVKLRLAVDRGFVARDKLAAERLFRPLHDRAEFIDLLETMRR